MKLTHLLLSTALLVPWSLQAQSEVPNRISYQGIVTDVSGNLVGDPNPENRTVVFRIWDNATAAAEANLIYSEQQVVTIAMGEFSVLVGAGAALTTTPLGFPEAAYGPGTVDVADAFGGSGRYLGVTVDDGTAAADVEISPRQQIVTTAFSFRAKEAESVINGGIVESALANGSVTLNKMATGAVNSNSIVNGSIITEDFNNGSVTKAKLGSDVGLWDVSGGNVYRGSGDVGIGTANPAERLHVAEGFAGQPYANAGAVIERNDHAYLQLNSPDSNYAGLVFGRNGTAQHGGIYYDSSERLLFNTDSQTRMIITSAGRVGIGTTNPANQLSVFGNADMTRAAIGTTVSGIRLDVAIPTPTSQMTLGSEAGIALGLGQRASGKYGLYFGTGGDGKSWIQGGRTDSIITAYDISLQASGGNVGIGTITPSNKLTVAGQANFTGKVGIGTASPTKAFLEINGTSGTGTALSSWGQLGRLSANSGQFTTTASTGGLSLYSSGRVAAGDFIAFSDERIKRIQGRSDSASDLATLLGIEITDYSYIDTITKGAGPHKKVIAQQVEEVYPQAVSKSTDEVPDILKKATHVGGWVALKTDLKVGERVRLIGEKEEGIHEVLEIRADAFRTAFIPSTEEVFVYGREVDDFRSVDYEAIAMLNVSATQELVRKLERSEAELARLRSENEAMARKLANLEAKDQADDARLAAVEELLRSVGRPAVRPVSLKSEVAAK